MRRRQATFTDDGNEDYYETGLDTNKIDLGEDQEQGQTQETN
jgi:hypothetical protein